MKWGKLIVIEGLDGCGKSTQLDLALGYLNDTDFIKAGKEIQMMLKMH